MSLKASPTSRSEKSWPQAVKNLHVKSEKGYPISGLCELLGVSKRAYFKRYGGVVLKKAAREPFRLGVHSLSKREGSGDGWNEAMAYV